MIAEKNKGNNNFLILALRKILCPHVLIMKRYLVLGIILSIFFIIQNNQPLTVNAANLYTMEFTIDNSDYPTEKEREQHFSKEIAKKENCEEYNIIIKDKKIKGITYFVTYSYTFYDVEMEYDVEDNDEVDIFVEDSTLTGDLLNQYIKNELLKQHPESEITDIDVYNIWDYNYVITYQLYQETEEYKLSMADFLKSPSTKKDSKAVLSQITLYIQGYRIPFLLEDGGEYYILSDDLGPFYDTSLRDLLKENPEKPFYNLNWTSSKKVGEIIGTIKKKKNDVDTNYIIDGQEYCKLSTLIKDWRRSITYDKNEKCFIYGTKPSKKEKALKTDVIYEFVKNAIKGCKTTEDQIKAIHDAIVLRCSYDKKNMAHYNNLIEYYDMTTNQAMALHMLNDKTGVCENYARLFQECCKRLFIRCDLITGWTSAPHMWNRVYIGNKEYHLDATYTDYLNNNYKKASDIGRMYFMKSAYDFMATHMWGDYDYTPYEFSKSWKNIDRNNITTTEELRKAVIYASYLTRDMKEKTFKFYIRSNKVNINCGAYIANNGFGWGSGVRTEYKNGILTVTYNYPMYN